MMQYLSIFVYSKKEYAKIGSFYQRPESGMHSPNGCTLECMGFMGLIEFTKRVLELRIILRLKSVSYYKNISHDMFSITGCCKDTMGPVKNNKYIQ